MRDTSSPGLPGRRVALGVPLPAGVGGDGVTALGRQRVPSAATLATTSAVEGGAIAVPRLPLETAPIGARLGGLAIGDAETRAALAVDGTVVPDEGAAGALLVLRLPAATVGPVPLLHSKGQYGFLSPTQR